jgi:hypothetical protein
MRGTTRRLRYVSNKRHAMNKLRALSAVFTLCLLAACSSPGRRIEKNPALFAALTPKQQELVRGGRISEGMTKDAVWLAWGRADQVRRGTRAGNPQESWLYFASYSEAVPAWRYEPVACYRGWRMEPFYQPDYIQHVYVYRFAVFEGGRVCGWEDTWLRK